MNKQKKIVVFFNLQKLTYNFLFFDDCLNNTGGISAGYHLISPISRDLFKRAIMQSGSPLVPTMLIGIETGPVKLEMLLNITDCPYIPRKNQTERYVTFTDDTFKCLRDLPVEM